MTIEEMKKKKQELGYSVEELARLAGVPQSTIQKIFSGQTKSPRRDTIQKLTAVLGKDEDWIVRAADLSGSASVFCDAGPKSAGIVAEPQPPVNGNTAAKYDNPYGNKMQGEYTVEDYLALPDDKRYELIDGVIYEMSAPSTNHQVLGGYLYYQFMSCVEQHNMTCFPFIAPVDVQLDKDNKTMVEPDVILCCDPKLNTGKRLFGAPDFLAEVLSPSTRKKDIFIKLNKYKNAGVREYWMIDPDKQKVTVILFEEDDDISVYTFDDDIPVWISKGLCKVSFRQAKEWLV